MLIVWIGFIVLILALLALDLGVIHRRAHVIGLREALLWTVVWIGVALAFNVLVFFLYDRHWLGIGLEVGHELTGRDAAMLFFAGYLIERALSVDNIFVIAMALVYFAVPGVYQHRVLFWGILGALVMRGVMIASGTWLIDRLEWMVYVFGAILIITAVKMLVSREDSIEPEHNPLVRLARRLCPVTPGFHGARFIVRADGRRAITPLMIALIVVESSDLLFAVDSIPAVLSFTTDPFLVYTSNVFAILGLRALYFALAGLMDKFRYIKPSVVVLLAFVGVKMLISHYYEISIGVSLAAIAGILAVGVVASIVGARRDPAPPPSPPPSPPLEQPGSSLGAMALRNARRVVVLIVGGAVTLAGVVMVATPGPAFLVIPLGLAILATEFSWARRLLRAVVDRIRAAGSRISKRP